MLQPALMDTTRFSSCTIQFNSYGMSFSGKKIETQKFHNLIGGIRSHFPTILNSRRSNKLKWQKGSHLRAHIDDEEELDKGEAGIWSVIIPTYNRLPILKKCVKAMEEQRNYRERGIREYEIIVVDDGSTDGTLHFLLNGDEDGDGGSSCKGHGGCIISSKIFPHVKVVQQQKRGGAARARNLGILHSRGSVIVFIDSDLIVTPDFLKEHARVLYQCFRRNGDDKSFTYGRVINTNNFENPQSEPFKLADNSGAFFATGNVAISRRCLAEAAKMLGEMSEGPFDSAFMEYGWEDLELGVRLKNGGARLEPAAGAVGYHWHPPFSYDQLSSRIEQEKQRGRGAVHFYRRHPVYSVRYMIQMTPVHKMLWFVLTLGGLLNEKSLAPLIKALVASGRPRLAEAMVSPLLNWYTVQATNQAITQLK